MDLMNAMNAPAAWEGPRGPRSHRPDRSRWEEEPLVSFPTMLERDLQPQENAAPERATSADRSRENTSPTRVQEKKPRDAGSSRGRSETPDTEQETPTATDTSTDTTATESGDAPASAGTTATESRPQNPEGLPEDALSPLADTGQAAPLQADAAATGNSSTKIPVTGSQAGGPMSASVLSAGAEAVAEETGTTAVPSDQVPEDQVPDDQIPNGQVEQEKATAQPDLVPEDSENAAPADEDGTLELPAEVEGAIPQDAPRSDATVVAIQDAGASTEQVATTAAEATEPVSPAAHEPQPPLELRHAKQKYAQSQIRTDAEESRLTLADLGLDSASLDSGSLDTFSGREHLAIDLKSAALKGNALQQHIRNQVSRQVVDHLRSTMAGEKLTLRLNPEELGQVEIHLHALDEKLTISLSAESKQAETALKEGSRELADSIGEKSSRFNLVEVRVATGSRQDQGRNETQQDDPRRERENGQDPSRHQDQPGRRQQQTPHHQIGADEWAAFHLGGQ
ncbi:hypothetical protein CSA17_04080 [bacterium DOLJORAL78_65_58]|nr:MAG: hypothetical protein CSB20_07045 [bacterium DOLZORAL124_64_63]PIE76090.1 MAG: hypothetical protein CSA17_04080 [bacterium DOLJORAL78_65_58]